MDDIFQKLQSVQRKVSRLEAQIRGMKEEQQKTDAYIEELKATLRTKDESIEALQQQYEAAQVVKQLVDEGDRDALQAKIDLYIQEIDICLKNFGD